MLSEIERKMRMVKIDTLSYGVIGREREENSIFNSIYLCGICHAPIWRGRQFLSPGRLNQWTNLPVTENRISNGKNRLFAVLLYLYASKVEIVYTGRVLDNVFNTLLVRGI